MNAQEDVESRLQRLKLETAVIEQHNERLENNKKNASDKLAADAVADSEVSGVIELQLHSLSSRICMLMHAVASHLYCRV